MCLQSGLFNLLVNSQNGTHPPTELGHMHFPCNGYFGNYRPEKYRAALADLEQNRYMLCRPGHVPAKLNGWGCMIRVKFRTDKRLWKQLDEIKRKAREQLKYLEQYSLDYQRSMSGIFAEQPVDGTIVITSPVLSSSRVPREY